MVVPNWQTRFGSFPEIPLTKQWPNDLSTTREQRIVHQLLTEQTATHGERQELKQLSSFYEELRSSLKVMNYVNLGAEEVERFKAYVLYAFNYAALVTNDLTLRSTYRLVLNESVTGKNHRITEARYLGYPPREVVRKLNRYNRANTPETNLFYSSENVDTTLKELRPPLNRLVTLGIWEPRTTHPFVSYPISHERAIGVNEGVEKALGAFTSRRQHVDPQVYDYLRYYLEVIGGEYVKPVGHHQEYVVSAWLSERIFESREHPWKFDCIIYPSVGNDLRTDNIAMLPAVVDERLRLRGAVEFEVEEAFYDRTYSEHHPEQITLARVKNVVQARSIGVDGMIDW